MTFLATLTVMTAPTAVAETTNSADCSSLAVPVTIGALHARVHGTLCHPSTPSGSPSGPALQLLIPGATYNSTYWDGEGIPAVSYTAAATKSGFPTLAIDRLGTGNSTRPVSAAVTAITQASAIHQVITQARSGQLDGIHYGHVALVGHSLGSLDAVVESATYRDAAAIVLTGYTHTLNLPMMARVFATDVRPATTEGFHTDPGYFTTAPGVRQELFDSPGDIDPTVAAADEAHKDVVSAVEIVSGLALGLNPSISREIAAPVFEVNGGHDTFFCGATTSGCTSAAEVYARESSDYGGPLSTFVQPDAGHDISLARDNMEVAAVMQKWLRNTLEGHATAGPVSGR